MCVEWVAHAGERGERGKRSLTCPSWRRHAVSIAGRPYMIAFTYDCTAVRASIAA